MPETGYFWDKLGIGRNVIDCCSGGVIVVDNTRAAVHESKFLAAT